MLKSLAEKIPKKIQDAIEVLKSKERYLFEKEAKSILRSILKLQLTISEMEKILDRRWGTIKNILSFHRISISRKFHQRYSDDSLRVVVDCYRRSRAFVHVRDNEKLDKIKEEMINAVKSLQAKIDDEKPVTLDAIRGLARGITYADLERIGRQDVKLPLKWGKSIKEIDSSLSLILEKRSYKDPEVLEMSWEAWSKPGARVACLSGIANSNDGFRAGLIRLAAEIIAAEGAHYIEVNAHIFDEEGIKKRIKEETSGLKAETRKVVTEHILKEVMKSFAAFLPKIKKPRNPKKTKSAEAEFIRWYLSPSIIFDGKYGEKIIQLLQMERKDDIRQGKTGGDRSEVKEVDKIIWFLNPLKSRLASKYYSAKPEVDINEKRKQTSQFMPYMWGHGGFASNIHVPSGARPESYFTIPALRRLEESRAIENQIGLIIVEFQDKENYSIKSWSLKDLVARERSFITGIATGADKIHRRIVEAIKIHGALTVGLLADKTGMEREDIERKIKFLTADEMSDRKTWPGLYYNESSQKYDFYLPWIQECLRYPSLPDHLVEDFLLFEGCPHFGYTTTDYENFIIERPKIILKNRIKIWSVLGDFIAGLHHDFMCSGEIFGQMNNTEQEQLAADFYATVIYKVFTERFNDWLKEKKSASLSAEQLISAVKESLILFLYIPGNHDLWQELDGNTPLTVFRYHLIANLTYHIGKMLADMKFPAIPLNLIVSEKIVGFQDYEAKFVLPSGLNLGMMHPQMGRTLTTSLRAQHAMEAMRMNGCHITGIANFHTAAVVHEWNAVLGQCVVVQAGTQVIYTRFERRKMKSGVDFGPILLKIQSHDKRIITTESAFFNKPFLKKPINKATNPDQLRRDLDVLTVNL
ncbi:MAG: hypothetical protein AAB807_00205 [Patescibacteria group bacterium]